MKRALVLCAALLLAVPLAAQTVEAEHADDFQSYAMQFTPAGWTDTPVGTNKPLAEPLWKTWADPLDTKNVAFGAKTAVGNSTRTGAFTTLTTEQFGARFEYRGRVLRTDEAARLGISFFSGYPERDAYYLIALIGGGGKRRSIRSQAASDLTMQLVANGGGVPQGTLDSEVWIEPGKWFEFRIETDDFANATHIRAKFWERGTPEPATWQIEAKDTAIRRLAGGRIGLWTTAAGESYFDDLSATSWSSEVTRAEIRFFDADTGGELDPSRLALFRKPARIDVRVTGGTAEVTIDGQPFSGAPIASDGMHELTARSGFVVETLRLLVDQQPPVIALLGNNAPLADGTVFGRDVTVDAKVTDVSKVEITSTLGALPLPLAKEAGHSITVTAVDQVGWESTASASFIIDKTAPVVTILGNGSPFLSGHTFNNDVTLTWSATDATLEGVSATLDGQPIESGAVVSAQQLHALVVTATDRAGHTTRAARDFTLRKGAPEVRLLANGAPLAEKTYGVVVRITAEVIDPTATAKTATLDGRLYDLGTPIDVEGAHSITVTARNEAGFETTVGPVAFSIDVTAPVIALSESGAPFRDGMTFNRNVLPSLSVTDNLTAAPKRTLLVNGVEFAAGAAISEERAEHTISATATDDAGHTAAVGPFRFVLDKTRPVVTLVEEASNEPFAADALFARPVKVKVSVADLTRTDVTATLGGTPIDINQPIAGDGTHQLTVIATDAVGWQSEPARAAFTIDTIAPRITFTTPAAESTLGTATVDVSGNADDAVSIVINGRAAAIDVARKTFALDDVALSEGRNELVAIATDRAGNRSTTPHAVHLDTRGPDVAVTAPAAGACLDATSIEVRGTVSDRAVASVKVNGVNATIAGGAFTANVPAANEGAFVIAVEAADAAGHVTRASVPVVIDRTAPVIEVTEGGQPFTAALLNRPVALFVRVTDASEPTVVTTLNGQPYAGGTAIGDDRVHELTITATDCAGHSVTRTVRFEIDRTPPSILTLDPQTGSAHGAKPQIRGTTSPDAVTIAVEPGSKSYAVANASFTIADAPLLHGTNDLRLTVADRAGNRSERDYSLVLDLTTPEVEIVENGAPIPPDAVFARDVTPVIRATERDAAITATLNGNAFSSGTVVTAAGAYTLIATANDAHGHTSQPVTATFTIDRTGPAVAITSPANGAFVSEDRIDVRGTVGGNDVRAVSVNGVNASVANGAFSVFVPVDFGPNELVATAIDRAGNAASDQVSITRGTGPLGILLTAPFDGLLTNRRTVVVAGQILTAAPDAKVTLNGVEIAVDPGGFFRKTDFALAEGENAITAKVTAANGETNQTSVRVTADLTPPRVRLLESGQPLAEGSRFADRAVISVEATDGAAVLTPQLVVDSDAAPPSTTIDEDGGHTLVATARDAAGNEARVERTIFIGEAGTAACRLDHFDPVHGSVVTKQTVTISGRCGGAIGVKVNGTPAVVANGSFCATIELPAEGDNAVTIVCTDADGNPTGDPATLVLRRATSDPSIGITAPGEGSVAVTETVTVTGTAAGATAVEVNGAPATLSGDDWTAENVRLAAGLNVIVARARNAAGRTAAASRRVLYLKDAPSLTITSPAAALLTGSTRIDLSGGWSGLDPTTLKIGNLAATPVTLSDTTGTWSVADVPLQPGENTLTVTGRDAAGRIASASVAVTLAAGTPSVAISEPLDNAVFPSDSGDTFTVRGTFTAAAGATVEVAGEAATLSGNQFTATVAHTASRITPVIVRVTEPAGGTGFDAVRVTKLAAKPKVLEHFPALDAFEAGAGTMPLVLFSQPMERDSTAAAFRLENASGSPVSGTVRVDRDVLTFAPAALLAPGERYTIRVAATAKSISGEPLESALASSFTTASSAGSTAPTLAPIPTACAQQIAISGTAPPSARLRLDLGPLSFTTTATASGSWTYPLPAGGTNGYQVVRVRIVGADGSLSPAAESCFLVDCAGPQVVSASFDRAANRLTIHFSKDIKPSTATAASILLRLADNRVAGGTVGVDGKIVTITPSEDLAQKTFTLEVTTAVEDLGGTRLSFPHTQTFPFDVDAPPAAGDGSGFMSGEVFDAATGRPLAGASVFVDVTAAPLVTDARGRYAAQLPEGAHTIRVAATGYTTVWRQIAIPPGAGVIPIDIRLTPIAPASPARTPSTQAVELTLVDAQSLPGLLPLGWSPLAAAVAKTAGQLEFTVDAAEVTAAAQVLTVVRYHEDRDEWRVLAAAANIIDGKVTVPIDEPGAYALVYPDKAPELAHPPVPTAGAVLTGVSDPCALQACPPLEAESFVLDPKLVLPTGKTVATLKIKGAPPFNFPSGTAVQAYIDEELRLADGSRVTDPPFTTDLLLYRNLAGTLGVAEFKLGPSPRAAEVILDIGFNHIRILPYPGRLDRGTLIGPEGGRVPGDGRVTVEIPAGAATEAVRASSATIEELSGFSVPGFTVVGGFTLTLQLAREVAQPEGFNAGPLELLQSARATFPNVGTGQYVLVEVLDGPLYRLASQLESIAGVRVTTKAIDRAVLPLDGVIREGRYLLLKADAPIAFATGILRDPNGLYLRAARLSAPPLGTADLTRVTGTYAVPVPAAPAAPFTLQPSSEATGEGSPYTHPSAPAADAVIRVDLTLQAVPPRLLSTEPAANAAEVTLVPLVKAVFDRDIDATSVGIGSIVVVDASTEQVVAADVILESPRVVTWRLRGGEERLKPNATYAVAIAPTIRGTNGTPFGRTHNFRFSTQTQVTSGDIHPEKIRITIPDANGRSRVIGAPGALPLEPDASKRFIALVTRRGVDFLTPFQAQASADGSLTIDIAERVELTDLIDLQVLNSARAVAAIIPLTPFITDDGRGFIAPPDRAVTFHGELATITVAAGSFDVPTLITTAPAAKSEFTAAPNFDDELNFHTGLAITFDGMAKKPLEVEIPIPAGTATDGKTFFLARLGDSARGPRLEIDDTLSIQGNHFTTRELASGPNLRIGGQSTFTGQKVKDYLMRLVWGAGKWAVVDIKSSLGALAFAATAGIESTIDLFFSHFQSLYCSTHYLTAARGRAVFPILAGKPFTVEGVDSGTGLRMFQKAYDGVPLPPDPSLFTPVDSPMPNESGPYPVFARPMYVQLADLHSRDLKQFPTRGLSVELPTGSSSASVNRTGAAPAEYGVLNVRNGDFRALATAAERSVTADVGDRVVVFGSSEDVAPTSELELVFNEAIDYDDDPELLRFKILLQKKEREAGGAYSWMTVPIDYRVDSGGRRVFLRLRGELQRGGEYRTLIRGSLSDTAPSPLALGVDVILPFTVRKPHGDLLGGPFSLPDGSVRDMALDGNLLFVSATEGDLLAYDVSDPARLDEKRPISRASRTSEDEDPDPQDIPGETWAVQIDPHGRIWTTAMTDRFGVIRSFRVEDFAKMPNLPNGLPIRPVKQIAASIVSWVPGTNSNLPLGTTWMIQSDRPEAIPRRLQIATQDETFATTDLASIAGNALGAVAEADGSAGGFVKWNVTIPRTPLTLTGGKQFRTQRVTVRNDTAQLRWSADIAEGAGSATLSGVLARPGDKLTVMRNFGTFAAVTLLGYGVGFYDLNAIENNRRLPIAAVSKQFAEQISLTEGRVYDPEHPTREVPPCDESAQPGGLPCGPRALTYTNDAVVLPPRDLDAPPRFDVFALETRKGLVDVAIVPKPGRQESSGNDPSQLTTHIPYGENGSITRRREHLAFAGSFPSGGETIFNDHPRLTKIRKAFRDEERPLHVRFTGLARFDKNGKAYALIAAYNFGILVVDLTPPLTPLSLADVIWLPAGAFGVRHIAGTHYATAVDGEGRSMLIDLSRIDERNDVPELDVLACGTPCDVPTFPTVRKCLDAGPDPASPIRFGSDDPRILWKSEPDLDNLYGTLAPVADPDTGFVYSGDLLEQTVHVLQGLDPRLVVKAKVDEGPMQAIGAVVPLGLQRPYPFVLQPGNLGTFRIEVALPGSMAETLAGAPLTFHVESQRIPGAKSDPTPPGWPAAHLEVELRRVVPSGDPLLRYQKGWNYFTSDPIAVLADPRAAKAYQPAWNGATLAEKAAQGCFSCERPEWAADDPGTKEIYSTGRFLSIRPVTGVFTGRYSYLNDARRLETTLGTVMADTIRPPAVQVAAQSPPIAGGMLQETTYLHSGEVETSHLDLDAGGRNGWNVAIARVYRSRTLGWTPFGLGWDGPMFKRLRLLPNGNIEYRDGAEVWTFRQTMALGPFAATIASPPGLFFKLSRDIRGWKLVDQQKRIIRFDEYGRVLSEADEFVDPDDPSKGSTIHYVYGEDGALARIVDPVKRQTSITYDAGTGLLNEISDWRARKITYDQLGAHLRAVRLPEAAAAATVPPELDLRGGNRPKVEYEYELSGSGTFADAIELKTNLTTIKDPAAAAPRVRFAYELADAEERDRVLLQTWGTGEEASFDYIVPSSQVVATDVLEQKRTYTLLTADDARQHIRSIIEHAVPVVAFDGSAPITPTPTTTTQDFVTTFNAYNDHGQVVVATMPNGLVLQHSYEPARSGAAGTIPVGVVRTGPGLSQPFRTTVDYENPATHPNAANNVASVSQDEGGEPQTRETQTPSRDRNETVSTDTEAAVKDVTRFNVFGQVTDEFQGDPAFVGPLPLAVIARHTSYHAENAAPYERSRPSKLIKGTDGEQYDIRYFADLAGGERVEVRDVVRGTVTETRYDAYGRKTAETITDASGAVLSLEKLGYDGNGRLRYHSRQQTPLGTVETTMTYDDVDRPVEQSISGAAVDGTLTTIRSRTSWQLDLSKITRFDPALTPGGSEPREITTIDRLGRPLLVERMDTAGNRIRTVFGYDANQQLAFESDGSRVAIFRQHDLLGRERVIRRSDGLRTLLSWHPWGELAEQVELDASGNVAARSVSHYTEKGRLRAHNEFAQDLPGDEDVVRQTQFTWSDQAKRRTATVGVVSTLAATVLDHGPAYRATETQLDEAGRTIRTRSGRASSLGVLDDVFADSSTSYVGALPNQVTVREPLADASYQSTVDYDALGRATLAVQAGAHETRTAYDEAGNVRSVKRPGMPAETAAYDSRGLAIRRDLPGGGTQHFSYDVRGTLSQFTDEAGEATQYQTDSLGRVSRIEYPDGTTEEMKYEDATGAVVARKDRAGQWLSYTYDEGGRVLTVRSGEDPSAAPTLIEYRYDDAKRLELVRNKFAGVAYLRYDLLGRPTLTKTIRFANGTGLDDSPAILDVHVQQHAWTIYDERGSFTLPANEPAVSIDDAFTTSPPAPVASAHWLGTIQQDHDAGSNLVFQGQGGSVLMTATGRSAGRLGQRRRMTADGVPLTTDYGYADSHPIEVALPSGAQPETGLPLWSRTRRGAEPAIAGISIGRDGAMRLDKALDLALQPRLSAWDYDGRGRLTDTWLLRRTLDSAPIHDTLIDADFRAGRTVRPLLTPAQHEVLGAEALNVEPPTWTAAKTPATHGVDSRTLYLDGAVESTIDYAYTGARRTTSGDWHLSFDELGRMTSAESAVLGRRIEYVYGPNDRIVGRSAFQPGEGGWTLEDRTNVLARDGLPARTTFVWDPIDDRLIAIFVAGASQATGAAPDSGLLRQYLHGDRGYDDPIRVVSETGTYFPIRDESGTGSLTAVTRADGTLVERVVYADAYGDAPRYLHGPLVDKITLEITKSGTGESVQSAKVRIHVSDRITPASVPTAARLAATAAGDGVAYLSPIAPTLEGDRTLLFDLSASEWQTLTTAPSAVALEIAVSANLRAEGWGPTPPLPIPTWALRVHPGTSTTTSFPVIKRESLGSLATFVASLGPGAREEYAVYAVPDLYLAAAENSKSQVLTGFKAAPFVEPATGLVSFRNRWYDPSTGTWLTPDAESYAAGSSNLYAGFNGDPVNNADPDGNEPVTVAVAAYTGWALLNSAIDTGIDYGFHRWLGEGEFNWGKSFGTNFAVNFATAGIGGKVAKLRYLKHLKNPVLRRAAAEGVEYAADVAVTGTIEKFAYGQSYGEAYGSAAVGGGLGRGVSFGLGRGARWLRSRSRYDYSADFEKDAVNFIGRPDYVDDVLNEDLLLVQYHRGDVPLGKGRSAKWWEPAAQANAQSSLDDVLEGLALVTPDWGPRNAVSVARIPRGTPVTYYIGQAAAQRSATTGHVFRGRGVQLRFRDFDPNWITATRMLPP